MRARRQPQRALIACSQATASAGPEIHPSMTKNAIDDCMRASVEQYLHDLRGAEPGALHDLFLGAAERPLLDVVLKHAQGNQSKAAEWLGINRNTLRRKLLDHKLIK